MEINEAIAIQEKELIYKRNSLKHFPGDKGMQKDVQSIETLIGFAKGSMAMEQVRENESR